MATMTAAAPVAIDAASDESPAARAWRRLRRRKSAMFGLVVIAALVLLALLAPLIAPYDPAAAELEPRAQAAVVAQLARHRRVGPRPVVPRDLRCPRLADGGRRLDLDRGQSRRTGRA